MSSPVEIVPARKCYNSDFFLVRIIRNIYILFYNPVLSNLPLSGKGFVKFILLFPYIFGQCYTVFVLSINEKGYLAFQVYSLAPK